MAVCNLRTCKHHTIAYMQTSQCHLHAIIASSPTYMQTSYCYLCTCKHCIVTHIHANIILLPMYMQTLHHPLHANITLSPICMSCCHLRMYVRTCPSRPSEVVRVPNQSRGLLTGWLLRSFLGSSTRQELTYGELITTH